MYDVIIIGRGPAGISAALYTIRANIKTLIIGKRDSSLIKTDKIENYYGFEQPISGQYLLNQGEEQAKRIGAQIFDEEVIGIEKLELFKVITTNNVYEAKSVLIATGQPSNSVSIKNLSKFEGKGISYCSTCDGFFYRGQNVGILGFNDFAFHEAEELKVFTKNITIFTNGKELEVSSKYEAEVDSFTINKMKIERIDGKDTVEEVVMEDGTVALVNGIFVAYGTASSISFALKMGIMTNGNSIITDVNQKTNIDGLFAAGDCTGTFKQISVAVGQGAIAGKEIISYIRGQK